MNERIEKIINDLSVYESVKTDARFLRLDDTLSHELHRELDNIYDVIEPKEIESDVKVLGSYVNTIDDSHKKTFLFGVLSYIQQKI